MSTPEFRIMGILNVTPDSFSDGGSFLEPAAALAHGHRLRAEGADIIDVGGESTRPGAEPLAAAVECERVLGVIQRLAAATDVQISIDTTKAPVARAALEAGATMVNDVSALRGDPELVGVVAEHGADCCLMHMQGQPRTMQRDPRYRDVVVEVRDFLEQRLAFAVAAGVAEDRILLDPGIGFGKTALHNLQLLLRLEELRSLGRPLVIGTSRKSFLGRIAADARGLPEALAVGERLPGTLATSVMALERGASVFRVHDVEPVRDALVLAAATLTGRWTARSPGTTRRT